MAFSLKLLNLLSVIERKHGIAKLDPSSRALLDIIIQRQVGDKITTAEDVIALADVSRASVYRKLSTLKDAGCIDAIIVDNIITYRASPKMNKFVKDLVKITKDVQTEIQ